MGKLELFNEIATMLIIYHLACFTDFYDNIEYKYHGLGMSLIYLTYAIIGVNTLVLILNFFDQAKKCLWRRRARKRFCEAMANNRRIMIGGQQ